MLFRSGVRESYRFGISDSAGRARVDPRDRRSFWPLLIKVDSCTTLECSHGPGVSVSVPPDKEYVTRAAQIAALSDVVPAMAAVLRLLLPAVGDSAETISVGELPLTGRVEGSGFWEDDMPSPFAGVHREVADVPAHVHPKYHRVFAKVKSHFVWLRPPW